MELCAVLLAISPFFPLPAAGAGGGSCTAPTTPCAPGSTPGQLPVDANVPGPYGDFFGTPFDGCATCIEDPHDPGGRGCIFSEWTSTLPATPGVTPLQVLKFQPPAAGATLVQAELRVRATLCGVLRVENRDPDNLCQALLTLATQIDVAPVAGQGLDFLTALLPSLSVSQDELVTLGPFDGTVDFRHTPPPATNPSGFPSGMAHASSNLQDELCIRITDPAQLAAFTYAGTGPSLLLFDHTANDGSSVVGCAPITFKSDPFAGVEVEVTYTYCSSQALVCEGEGQVDGAVGEELVLTWTGTGTGPLGFSVSGLPAGAVVTPDPFGGPYASPLVVTATWTPDASQLGTFEFCVTFLDANRQSETCCTSVNVSECHLILADGPGTSVVTIGGHAYQTQVQGVQRTFPVMMGMNPSFPLVVLSPGHPNGMNARPALTAGVPLRQFVAQIVMFNPPEFPSNPEQYTNPIAVVVWSDGRVTAQPYGVADNMAVQLRVYTDANGDRFYTFPFTIVNWP